MCCITVSLLNFLILISLLRGPGWLSCVCFLSAFVHFVFTCAVAKKQNGRICKNTVLMETAFHSTSGFHLNSLIRENVTISVLREKEREKESKREREKLIFILILPRQNALSTTVKLHHRLIRVHVQALTFKCNACFFECAAHTHRHTHPITHTHTDILLSV